MLLLFQAGPRAAALLPGEPGGRKCPGSARTNFGWQRGEAPGESKVWGRRQGGGSRSPGQEPPRGRVLPPAARPRRHAPTICRRGQRPASKMADGSGGEVSTEAKKRALAPVEYKNFIFMCFAGLAQLLMTASFYIYPLLP